MKKNMFGLCRSTTFTVFFTASLLIVSGGSAFGNNVVSGILEVDTDDDYNIIEAALKVQTFEKTVYYSIVLNEMMKMLVEELEGLEVEIVGRLFQKDHENWVEATACYRVITGTVICGRDDEGKVNEIVLDNSDTWDSYTISVDEKSTKFATKMEGRTVRIVGTVKETDDDTTLTVESYAEFVKGIGTIEPIIDDDGRVTAVEFTYSPPKESGKEKTYVLNLDKLTEKFTAKFEYETVELTGILVESKGKVRLSVLTCIIVEPEEEEIEIDDEDDDDEEDDWEDEDDGLN